jgi:hypothetical protein
MKSPLRLSTIALFLTALAVVSGQQTPVVDRADAAARLAALPSAVPGWHLIAGDLLTGERQASGDLYASYRRQRQSVAIAGRVVSRG